MELFDKLCKEPKYPLVFVAPEWCYEEAVKAYGGVGSDVIVVRQQKINMRACSKPKPRPMPRPRPGK